MVRVDEAAVAQAADLELPQRAVASQCLQLHVELVSRQAVDDSCREAFDAGELAADARMNREQHPIQRLPAGGLRSLLEGEHGSSRDTLLRDGRHGREGAPLGRALA